MKPGHEEPNPPPDPPLPPPKTCYQCPRGHRWEELQSSRLPGDVPSACPVCGAGGIRAVESAAGQPAGGAAILGETLPADFVPVPAGPPARPAATEIVVPEPSLPPYRFGHYELLDKIGKGGMGMVYKARHLHLGRVEALKVISANRLDALKAPSGEGQDAESLRRWLTLEMQTLAKLQHPNIVEVYGAGEVLEELYFSMAYEEGGDLAQLVKREGPLPPRRAAELMRQVADAVAYAHQQHTIHRDLKPQNVLLSKDGTARVTDFGLALLLARGESGRLAPGTLVGTPAYMPPEQTDGQSDERSDVYGLGAILYELLTGQPPLTFAGETTRDEVVRRVREERPPRPRALNDKVPPALEAVCLKCLEKEPARRYRSAGQVAAALRAFLRPPWWQRHWRELAAGACLLVGLAFWGWWALYQGPRSAAANEMVLASQTREKGHRTQALTHYQAASDIYKKLLDGYLVGPDRLSLQLGEAEALMGKGIILESERQAEPALTALNSAQDLLEKLPPADRTCRPCRLLMAEVYHNLGVHFDNLSDSKQAFKNFSKGLTIRRALQEEIGTQPEYRRDLARSLGYLGNTQLQLGRLAEARTSSAEAEQLRAQLLDEKPDDAETLCLHARDFGNLGDLYDWTNQVDKALEQFRRRVGLYARLRPPFDERLPGDYLTERADARLKVVELELDRDQPAADVPVLLDQAEAEYKHCWPDAPEADTPLALKALLGRAAAARGKYHFRRQETRKAAEALQVAEGLLKQVRDANALRPYDLYRLAVVRALDAQLHDPERDDLALDVLGAAVGAGFKHLERLKREHAFRRLQESHRQQFQDILREVEKKRGWPAGSQGKS
jgi:tetratricopeptide (TPR) repeat protein